MLRVLVIVPTQGKRPEMLEEALESIAGQTRNADELVIACGETPLSERLNTAIARSDCDAFVMLSDDDKLDPMFLEKTVKTMEENGVDIVYTDCHIFGRNNCPGGALGKWTKENIDRNTVPLVTSLCSKKAWAKAGGYENVPFFDWDFWWRCFYSGATAHWLKQPLFWYRDHAGQCSASQDLAEARRISLARFEQLRSVMA